MKKKGIYKFSRFLMTLFIVFAVVCGVFDYIIPERIVRYSWQDEKSGGILSVAVEREAAVEASASLGSAAPVRNYPATVRLFGTLPLKEVEYTVYDRISLCPGGMPFGVKIYTSGLVVTGTGKIVCGGREVSPASDCGIKAGDIILTVNGEKCLSSDKFIDCVQNSRGDVMTLSCRRGESEYTANITPVLCDSENAYRTGMWIRDSSAGIGTVTFIDPTSGAFAGLGHGICDSDTGTVMPLSRGTVVDVSIAGITKGMSGTPGELIGSFKSGKTGTLIGNTGSGVFGVFNTIPTGIEVLPIALSNEVKEGEAYIQCTLDGRGVRKYSVNIETIARAGGMYKNFTLRVTDPELLELTGGIIQGMSGSPVIQNGRLVGALTHVLVNDPRSGYGIFIENMLAEMPELLK